MSDRSGSSDGEMCVFCGENTEDHRNPFGYLASGVYGCHDHSDAEILRAWCEQRLADEAMYDFIAENPGDALDEIDRLGSLSAELLAVVKRTLSLFEAMAVDLPEIERLRELVTRAEK